MVKFITIYKYERKKQFNIISDGDEKYRKPICEGPF